MDRCMNLYRHQEEALLRAKNSNLALFHDCGTGKTVTALEIIEHFKNKGAGPALVVCPLSVIETAWIADCRKFTPELSIVSLWSKKRCERYKALSLDRDIYAVNFETFRLMFDDLQEKKFGVLIVDESSKIKNPRSKITRALLAFAGVQSWGSRGAKYKVKHIVPHRYVLSGTPAPNNRSEYWSQMTFVEPGKIFSKSFFVFRNRYFTPRPLGRTGVTLWDFTKDSDLQARFSRALSPWCHAVSKADAVDLPEQIHVKRKVHLSTEERRAYDTFRKQLVLSFADEDVLGTSALTEIMKARQLTSGFCYGEKKTHITGKTKLGELKGLLEEIGDKQVIIWCSFKNEAELIKDGIKDSQILKSGSDTETIDAFRNGKFRYLIANPQSAGHGLTFTNCSYAVYFSLTYSYELFKQSQDRIHRIGQKNRCTYFYLLAENTIDEVLYRALMNKEKLSNEVLNYLKEAAQYPFVPLTSRPSPSFPAEFLTENPSGSEK